MYFINLNGLKTMQHRLHGLRGNNYRLEYKRLYELLKDELKIEFDKIYNSQNKFIPKDLGRLANQFLLPLTALDDFLNSATDGEYPIGTWDRLKDRGLKARDIGVMWE